ncbi:MAG: acyl-[ACP]--phospholipid O-acyltransferase [Gammaproteobacteria bacterium]|nr:acyl-[ACP]--phospholipid O-acyltransferase [Gammaproteobacteria bacterium]
MLSLFRLPSFTPYILIVLLNAFVDLGHKIMVQNTVFKIYDDQTQIILTAIVNGLILLPFILLFTPSGFLADRHPKPKVMKISAALAILITLGITLCYYQGWFQIAFAMTFLLAVQSTFYSPAKYGYIKEMVGDKQLSSANAIVQSVTIIAILGGIFLFSILFEQRLSGLSYQNEADILLAIAPLGWILVFCSIAEFLLALRLPNGEAKNPNQPFPWAEYRQGRALKHNLKSLFSNPIIWLAILGLSLFWGISQVLLAAFPSFAKQSMGEMNTVVIQGLMACSGIGIIVGSILAGRASKHQIELALIPLGALSLVVSLLLLPQLHDTPLLALNFILFGIGGGLLIVPLNALIQHHAKETELGIILAGNNWVQNITMICFLALTVLFALNGYDSSHLFYFLTTVALLGTFYTLYKLPKPLVRFLVSLLFSIRYRLQIIHLENMPKSGAVLLLGNHISWLDWAFIQIASPRPVHFVMDKKIYNKWYLTRFLNFFGVIPISAGGSQSALRKVNQQLRNGEVVCLFPEGSISRNGHLNQFKRGFEKTVNEVNGVILPFYLHGLWGSRFSRSGKKMQSQSRQGLRRNLQLCFGKPLSINSKRSAVKQAVMACSVDSWQQYIAQLPSISQRFIQSSKRLGSNLAIADLALKSELSGYKLLTAVLAFSGLIAKRSPEQNIGLLLPTSSAGLITNMAALLRGKTVVNLNYTASENALLSALKQADIHSIYTSKRFVEKLKQRGMDPSALFEQTQVFYLEELKKEISSLKKLGLLICAVLLPTTWIQALFGKKRTTNQVSAILFSSGSEGAPKGVMLSQQNILANMKQIATLLDPVKEERLLSCLPLFHAFGLSVTGLMPLADGIPVVCHPDPTDVVGMAKGMQTYQTTVFCSTSTFLRLFNRNKRVQPAMLDSLRMIITGAEKLNAEVRSGFLEKFNKTLYEGYGTTETAPAASANFTDRERRTGLASQIAHKEGSVGLPLPGGCFCIVDPNTLTPLPIGEAGLVLFSGVQLMLGYLNNSDKTAEALLEMNGQRWYKTGDKGRLDDDGFLTLLDRYSRFAKIGGEMVGLTALEAAISAHLPEEVELLSCALPDGKKGEKVVLLVAGSNDLEPVKHAIERSDLTPLMKPSKLLLVAEIPKLGSGKSDFGQAKKIALEHLA